MINTIMDIPKNCRECEYDKICGAAHYGGSLCKRKEEINRETIKKMGVKGVEAD